MGRDKIRKVDASSNGISWSHFAFFKFMISLGLVRFENSYSYSYISYNEAFDHYACLKLTYKQEYSIKMAHWWNA